MRRSRLAALCLVTAFLGGCAAAGKAPVPGRTPVPPQTPPAMEKAMPPHDPRAGRQVAEHLDGEGIPGIQPTFLLYLPEGYPGDHAWPLLLFLHGSGERGRDVDRVTAHGPPRLAREGTNFPFVIVSPQCPAGGTWSEASLDRFLDEVEGRYRIDPRRVYLTGLSLGGYGAWRLAQHAPGRFAAVAPVCGGGDPSRAFVLKDVPVWAFHGDKDLLVPVEESVRMVEALEAAGGMVRLTVYPDTDHDSWTATYENPELYRWLLEQKQ